MPGMYPAGRGLTASGAGLQNNQTEEDTSMSERNTEKREREYADFIPDDETTERPETDEKTYRDGNVKNECWAEKE